MKQTWVFVAAVAAMGCVAATEKGDVASPELSALEKADSPALYQGDLELDQLAEGNLSRRFPYHYYTFEVEQAGQYFVDAASRDGDDLYLILYVRSGRGWSLVDSNDDCRGSLNSCLELDLESGEYAALVSTYSYLAHHRRAAASYHLRVVCQDCETAPACVVGGCSSQLCIEEGEPRFSTCEWRDEYACYQTHGVCERQSDGACGWTPTEELNECLGDASSPDDCRSTGCADGQYCTFCWAGFSCIPEGAIC